MIAIEGRTAQVVWRQRARRAVAQATSVAFVSVALLAWSGVARAQLPAPAVSSSDPIHLGGYAGMVVNSPVSPALERLGMTEGNAALLVSGTFLRRVGWFGELDAVSSSRQNYAGRQDERRLDAARLYGELTITDALRLRVGRFLTPVGSWNESPAEPLTWMAVRPLTTYRSFAKSATGAMIAGDFPIAGHDAGYAFYAVGGNWVRDHDEVRFSRAVGARAAIEVVHGVWLGGSGVLLRQVRPRVADDAGEYQPPDSTSSDTTEVGDGGTTEREVEVDDREDELRDLATRGLVGVDLRIRVLGAELSAEGTQLTALDGERTERGAFVQGVVPVAGPLFVVGRVERFEPRTGVPSTSSAAGVVLRPVPRLALKMERQWSSAPSARTGQGWYGSLSLLF